MKRDEERVRENIDSETKKMVFDVFLQQKQRESVRNPSQELDTMVFSTFCNKQGERDNKRRKSLM